MRRLILDILVVNMTLAVVALALASPSNAEYAITEIIDSTGDGGGNTLDSPYLLAVDSSGNVYATGMYSDNAFKIATPGTCSTGGTPCTITEIIDATGDGGGNTLSEARGVAVDSSGNVYVTGRWSGNAFKITPGATITEIIDSTGDGGGNTLGYPSGVAVDPSGNVYVIGSSTNNAFKITPGGTITEIIDATGDGGGNTLDGVWGVAVDSSGNVYVTGADTDNTFRIATPGTCSTSGTPCTITEIIDSTGDGGGNTLDYPRKVAVDSSGNVYVTGGLSDNAFKIAAPGACSTGGIPCTITEIIDATGDGGGNTLTGAWGVAADSSGNVYVAGDTSDNAFKIAAPGACSTGGTPCTITEIIDATGDGGGKTLDWPGGVAVDSSGNVYVTGWNSDNVFKIRPGLRVPTLSNQGLAVLAVSLMCGALWLIRRRRVVSA